MPKNIDHVPTVIYRSDFEKAVITQTCDRRGWARYQYHAEDEDTWNVYWASVHTVRNMFNPETGKRLADSQVINHFPNHYELTRKDLMVKNIKRYRKELEKRWNLAHNIEKRTAYSGGSRPGSLLQSVSTNQTWVSNEEAIDRAGSRGQHLHQPSQMRPGSQAGGSNKAPPHRGGHLLQGPATVDGPRSDAELQGQRVSSDAERESDEQLEDVVGENRADIDMVGEDEDLLDETPGSDHMGLPHGNSGTSAANGVGFGNPSSAFGGAFASTAGTGPVGAGAAAGVGVPPSSSSSLGGGSLLTTSPEGFLCINYPGGGSSSSASSSRRPISAAATAAGGSAAAGGSTGNTSAAELPLDPEGEPLIDPRTLDFIPTTFTLPQDYSLFVEEFRRTSSSWIMKPIGKAQGKGIFLVSRLNQVRKWATYPSHLSSGKENPNPFREPYIISRYIDNPLLIGGKKFDLRVYVLVTSFRPIRAYLYDEGFCRFCNVQYTTDVTELDNVFVHLTNVAIQKHAEEYNAKHGGKWSIRDLKLYLESLTGLANAEKVFRDIESLIIITLKSVQNAMINDKHCFELYGFDVLVDGNLKPWLLECNASPSLTTTTHEDRILKSRLIHDVLNIVEAEYSTPGCRTNVLGALSAEAGAAAAAVNWAALEQDLQVSAAGAGGNNTGGDGPPSNLNSVHAAIAAQLYASGHLLAGSGGGGGDKEQYFRQEVVTPFGPLSSLLGLDHNEGGGGGGGNKSANAINSADADADGGASGTTRGSTRGRDGGSTRASRNKRGGSAGGCRGSGQNGKTGGGLQVPAKAKVSMGGFRLLLDEGRSKIERELQQILEQARQQKNKRGGSLLKGGGDLGGGRRDKEWR